MQKSMKRYGEWALVTGTSSGMGMAMTEGMEKMEWIAYWFLMKKKTL